ncbi:MAG TPA: hypothetical protein VKC65_06265 [Gaiellaceae bacterium]|nr:hypothetical protein [Gaiellaceae bacterium]
MFRGELQESSRPVKARSPSPVGERELAAMRSASAGFEPEFVDIVGDEQGLRDRGACVDADIAPALEIPNEYLSVALGKWAHVKDARANRARPTARRRRDEHPPAAPGLATSHKCA